MKYFFQISFVLFGGLFACRQSTNNDISRDITFVDRTKLEAYLLYDDKYILNISIEDNHGKKYPATRFGFYHRIGDTIFATSPSYSSTEYKNIKTKYFWIEMHSGKANNGYEFVPADSLYEEKLFKDPVLIADSLFGTKFFESNLLDHHTLLVSVPFNEDTLLIHGGRLMHIRQ